MLTKLDVINMALGNLSNENFVESLEEENSEAIQAALRWDTVVDVVLSDFAWSFASRRAPLTLYAGSPEGEYHYLYPADCVKVRRLYVTGDQYTKALPFEIGRSTDGKRRVIIAFTTPITAVYTTRNVQPGEWPAGFANAIAWRLAAELAVVHEGDQNLAGLMLQSYAYQIAQAKLNDAEERGEYSPPASGWLEARNG